MKLLELKDYDLYQQYYRRCNYSLSNYNFYNMLMFASWVEVSYVIDNDIMYLFGKYQNEYYAYMPLCGNDRFVEGLLFIKEYLNNLNCKVKFACFDEEHYHQVLKIFKTCNANSTYDSSDYVYDFVSLQTFSGKKMQKKRNLINNFLKNYEYQWEKIDDIEKVKEFNDWWFDNHHQMYLDHDLKATNYILDNYDKCFGVSGIVIKVDEKVIGYIIGSMLNENTIQIHIQKANDEYIGIYQLLFKTYFSMYSNIKLVNLEDDLGLENLRHSKESYHPVMLINKYQICTNKGEMNLV
ncbi:MAG: phosphatidylglycerol lysyltransferase domain-containing protein [Erysipelotrichaceae bacterium]